MIDQYPTLPLTLYHSSIAGFRTNDLQSFCTIFIAERSLRSPITVIPPVLFCSIAPAPVFCVPLLTDAMRPHTNSSTYTGVALAPPSVQRPLHVHSSHSRFDYLYFSIWMFQFDCACPGILYAAFSLTPCGHTNSSMYADVAAAPSAVVLPWVVCGRDAPTHDFSHV